MGDVTLYKKAIGYGLLDFAEELNYGIELSTIKSGYPKNLPSRDDFGKAFPASPSPGPGPDANRV